MKDTMNAYLDCVLCFLQQALQAARIAASDEEKQEEVVLQPVWYIVDNAGKIVFDKSIIETVDTKKLM